MEKDKKNSIIVDEIHYWKKHKLLPAVYCDYLLALYTKGESIETKQSLFKKTQSHLFYSINVISLTLLLPISFLIIYFFHFSSIVKVGVLFLFIVFSTIMYRNYKKRNFYFYHLALIVLLMLILVTAVFIVTLFTTNQLIIQVIVLLNFISWLLLGLKIKKRYLIYSSVVAIVFMLFYIIN